MRAIPLTRGKYALVDDEDYERVAAKTWSAVHTHKGYFYARHAWQDADGYHAVKMHRFILDAPDGVKIDHINGNPLDNRRANLRFATHQQNQRNARPSSTTGYKGVTEIKPGRFLAQIIDNSGRQRYLGAYDSPEQAARAYDAAASLIDPEFHWRNFNDIDPFAMKVASHVLNGGVPSDLIQRRKHPNQKLNDEDVIAIRQRYRAGGVRIRDIAEEYGVCVAAVGHAIRGHTFAHITDPAPMTQDKRRRAA